MHYHGSHRTTYTYPGPVFLEQHTIRLRPRSDPRQDVREYSLEITPEPDGLTEGIDAWGNDVVWVWFSGRHDRLEIATRFVVETRGENPFDFIVPTSDAEGLTPSYTPEERAALTPYLVAPPGLHASVHELAADAVRAANHAIVAFPGELAKRIHQRCELVYRASGPPLPAAETLAAGRGSCRDLAMLFIDVCRTVGVAGRFISGYVAQRPPGEPADLHAWAGVYIPGGGWRAFDPSQGLAVSHGHVKVAAAAVPAGAAPIDGSFLSSDTTSELSYAIELDVRP